MNTQFNIQRHITRSLIISFDLSDNRIPVFTSDSVLYKVEGTNISVQLQAYDPDYPNGTDMIEFTLDPLVLGVTISPSGLLVWSSEANSNITINLVLTDDCGSSKHEQLSLAVIECPCQNAGKCIPVPDSAPGSADFTCQCVEGTTGQYCEIKISTTELPMTTSSSTTIVATTTRKTTATTTTTNVESTATSAVTTVETTEAVSVTSSMEWSSWSEWSECSRTSNYGLRTRDRECLYQMSTCPGSDTDTQLCTSGNCTGKFSLRLVIVS